MSATRSSQIRGNLPEGILEPQIIRVDAEDEPISYVGAQTTDMTLEQLSWYIDNTVAKRLLGLSKASPPSSASAASTAPSA